MLYSDRVVLITGASSGIGEALALEFARQGANLVLAARRLDRLEKLAERIRALGRGALAVEADVTRQETLEAAVARAVAEWGRLDVAVANAGFSVAGPFASLTEDDFRRQFETNVFGVLKTLHACLPELKKSRGQVMVMGSVAGHISATGATPYSMSKFAVRALCEGLRAELADDGVSLTLISPGFVASEIRQVDNQGRPKDVKDPIPPLLLMSASKAARQMVRALARGRAEEVVTLHGKLLVALTRYFPGLVRFLSARLRRRGDKSYSLGK